MTSVIEPDYSERASSHEWEKFFTEISKNSAFFKSYNLERLRKIKEKFKQTPGYVPDDHTIWQLEYDLDILISIDNNGNISYEEKPPIEALRQKVLEILNYKNRRERQDQWDDEEKIKFNDRLKQVEHEVGHLINDKKEIKKEIENLVALIELITVVQQQEEVIKNLPAHRGNDSLNFSSKQWAVLLTTIMLIIILIFWLPFYRDISWGGNKVYDTIHYIQTIFVALVIMILGALSVINLRRNRKNIFISIKSFSIINFIKNHKVGFTCFSILFIGTTIGLIIDSVGLALVSCFIPIYIFIINYAVKQNK